MIFLFLRFLVILKFHLIFAESVEKVVRVTKRQRCPYEVLSVGVTAAKQEHEIFSSFVDRTGQMLQTIFHFRWGLDQ